VDRLRVSVVIPCFNYGAYLREAVDSVLAQTLSADELIIVDDGSTDDSRAVAAAIVAEHGDPAKMRLIARENTGSPGATRNAGISEAVGDAILCLDADDRLDPGFLEACVRALDANPGAAIAYGDFQMFGDDDRLITPPQWDTRRELDVNFLGTASMFRRVAWEQAGRYDVELGYEDWDLWIGMIERGWVGVKAPGALWHYRVHGGGVFSNHVAQDHECKARIVLKHPSVYDDRQRSWAAAVLEGDTAALAASTTPGWIPTFDSRALRVVTGGRSDLPIRSICLITKDYPPNVPGGIPRAVQMQAQMLAAAGVEVHVITRGGDNELVREAAGVVVHEIPEPGLTVPGELAYLEIPLWSFVAAAKFAQLDASVRFDIVETPDYRGEALHLARRPQTPLIVWLHSTMMVVWNCEPGYVRSPADDAWHALEMAALERADLLLAPSQLLLDTTAGFLGDRMRPAELMPYLFDAAQFPVRHREPGRRPVRALFYGRLESRKNPELALHAVAAARAGGLDVELTFLGRNHQNYREHVVVPLARELGLEPRFLDHADTDTVRAVLAESDVAILASRFDNSPLTIFEALSSGVPVITSDRVGTAGWFEPDEGLLALPIDDAGTFAARAADAMQSETWMASGEVGAARMRDRFAPSVVTGRLLDCYGRLIAAREGGTVAVAPQLNAERQPMVAMAELARR
jgi:glycosyltransferase involved in cell wall biosynthesis